MAVDTIESLRQKQDGFHAPSVRIVLGGSDLASKGWSVRSVECETGIREEAGFCRAVLSGLYDAQRNRFDGEAFLVRGMTAEIWLGYRVCERVFKGYLYEIEYLLDEWQAPQVTLLFMDVKAAMMGCGTLDFSGGCTWKQVIEGFFSGPAARGYAALSGAPSVPKLLDVPVGYPPEEMDDYAFTAFACRRFGLEWFVQDGALVIREQPVSPKVLLSVAPEDGVERLAVRLRSAGYVRTVRVTGGSDDVRDSAGKKASGEAENGLRIASGNSDPGRLLGARSLELFSASVRDAGAAQALAEGRLRQRRQLGSELELVLMGLPELQPGYALELRQFSPQCNGEWYIVSVAHRLDRERFQTTVQARRSI